MDTATSTVHLCKGELAALEAELIVKAKAKRHVCLAVASTSPVPEPVQPTPEPVQRAPRISVVAVAGGWEHTVALLKDGTVRVWGASFRGQCDVSADIIPL